MSGPRFDDKESARAWVWDRLQADGAAAFPLPPHGRIPNFRGAKEAAERLMRHPLARRARRIKCNPDSPQRPVRQSALAQGIEVIVPTPRLKDGFRRLDPERIPPERHREASALRTMAHWAETVPTRDLPSVDLVVVGSVAVTRDGRRCGKGHGYGDIEYAILRELGHPAAPVATTVHPLQVVEGFPVDSHDLPVGTIVTPDETVEVEDPPPGPTGIQWDLLDAEAMREMPVLGDLRPEPP